MDNTIRAFIEHDLMSIQDIANFYGISIYAARARAVRGGWPCVIKAQTRFYLRSDLPQYADKRKEPSVITGTHQEQTD